MLKSKYPMKIHVEQGGRLAVSSLILKFECPTGVKLLGPNYIVSCLDLNP